MSKKTPQKNREKLSQLSTEELVEMILTQIEVIECLKQKIERLKLSKDLDSKISSKPPSSDLLKKSEKKKETEKKKRKPGGQPGQDLGIKLQGLLGWLGNYGHLPYEKQQELLWELGEIKIGVGTLVSTNQRVSKAIKKSVTALSSWVEQEKPPLNIDETPWSVKGVKEWLWVFANPQFCLFRAGDTRGRKEIQEQLGEEYSGVIISDDFNVYNGYEVNSQQKCLAHLRRHAQRLVKTPGKHNKLIGEELTALVDEAFKHHRNFRENQDDNSYFGWATEFKLKVQQTLKRWCKKAGYEAGKILRNLKLKAEQWWYFLDHPEIPPDNNLAERALRLAVTKRKVSGSSRSMKRFQETANHLTVIQTCRFQGRSVMNFFASALKASVGIEQQPSLIPLT